MTLERDRAADLFGLAGTFPRPGWVVLDAARDHRFTGELVFDGGAEIRVYLDRGRIYIAERSNEPSLGARLVDAGALNAAQLEHGSMRVGDTEHLGRLFERVPSVDRQSTLLITELMTESTVAWLAGEQVRSVVSTPYRHHPAGVHRWDRPLDAIDLSPGDPLPAPTLSEAPVEIAPPESVFADFSNDTDPVIHWDEPSWLDERLVAGDRSGDSAPPPSDPDPISVLSTDWADRLEHEGLPQTGSDPLAPQSVLPPLPAASPDRFEVIWPSGEVSNDDPAAGLVDPGDDRDRAGPTARVTRSTPAKPEEPPAADEPGLWDFETSGPSFAPPDDSPAHATDNSPTTDTSTTDRDDTPPDEIALSMRRAIASIETGSLAARRRLSDTSVHESSRGTELTVPGRVATRTESSVWSANRAPAQAARSVFDEPAPTVAEPTHELSMQGNDAAAEASEPERVSALRRLIGGLRRR